MSSMRIAGEEGALEYFFEQYRNKCDQFGDDPHHLIVQILEDALRKSTNLTNLQLNGKDLSPKDRIADDDVFALSESLAIFPDAPFASIDLSLNNIGNNGAKALGVMLKSTQSITSINLRANEISELGGIALAHALEGQKTLIELDLADNPIGDSGISSIGKVLGKPGSSLKHLRLNNTEMGIEAVVQIAKALKSNQTLEELYISNARITSLEDETSVHLSQMLQFNKTLRVLDLSKHRIRDDGVEWLVRGLELNTTLKVLNLSCNQIGSDGAIRIAKHLNKFSLISLDLSGNRLIDQGGEAIASSLKENAVLERLNLTCTCLGEASLNALAEAVRKNDIGPLKALMLWGNYFTPLAADSWRTALADTHTTLEYDFKPYIQPE